MPILANQITLEQVLAFKKHPPPSNAHLVQLNCPDAILREFKILLEGTSILGCSFKNPYTHQLESIPTQLSQLTARHLQILARIEAINTTGDMKVELYQGKLDTDQIAKLRCLVKATTVAGVTYATHSGGYHSPRTLLASNPKTIVIDQAGLQWQNDFRNTGGMFFYPANPYSPELPANYSLWQSEIYQVMHGQAKPSMASIDSMEVTWLGVPGKIDLNGVAHALDMEFTQALDAAMNQGNTELSANEQINFKFLKAGMGFFANGLLNCDKTQLELARLRGIASALERLATLPNETRQAILGKIKRIELPFSSTPPATNAILTKIQFIVEHRLHLQWGGTPNEDAFSPRPGFVNATTNCGDPHAMIGNEGGFSSVDAALSTNANLEHLNAAYNFNMQLRTSPDYQSKLDETTPFHPTSHLLGAATLFAERFRAMRHSPGEIPLTNALGNNILRHLITEKSKGLQRGSWLHLTKDSTIEIGVSQHSGYPAIATQDYQIELHEQNLVVLDKNNRFIIVDDPKDQSKILNEILLQIPETVLIKMQLNQKIQQLLSQQNPQSREWIPLEKICAQAQLHLASATPLNTWLFGRTSDNGNLAIANPIVQIEFRTDGTITILDKENPNQLINEEPLYTEFLRSLSDCFPDIRDAMQIAQQIVTADEKQLGLAKS